MIHWLMLSTLVAMAAKPSGPAVVLTRRVKIAGSNSGTLYHPALPGMKRLSIGGRPSRLIYEDRENNFYERIELEAGGAKRDLLQRIVSDPKEGARGEFRQFTPPGRAAYCEWAKSHAEAAVPHCR